MTTTMKFSLLLALLTSMILSIGPAQAEDEVKMDLDEFLQLYEQAKTRDDPPQNPPREFGVSAASYDGEVIFEDGEPVSALFKAQLRIDILKQKGWVQVPLLPVTVALQSARIGGRDAPLVSDGSRYYLVTDKSGSVEVELTFAVSVFTSEGRSGFSFNWVPAGSTGVKLAVPVDEDLEFVVANAQLKTESIEGGKRVVEALVSSTGTLSVTWQREIPETVVEEARVYAESYTLVGLGDGLIRTRATLQYTILQAGIDKLRVALPAGGALVDVSGAGIREWSVDDDGALEVVLNYAAEGSYQLVVQMEQVFGEGDQTINAPIVQALDVDRAKGWVGVEASGNIEVAAGEYKDVTPVDVRSLPAAILGVTSRPVLLGFKYLDVAPTLPLVIEQHEEVDVLVTLIDQAKAVTMFTPEGRRLSSVSYQLRNNRKQFLRLKMPEGAVVWSAQVAGRAVQPAKSSDGRILIPLVRSQTAGGSLASFSVEIVYVEDGQAPDKGKGAFRSVLPTADVPTTYVGWTIFAPRGAKILKKSQDGSLRHVEWLSQPFDTGAVANIQTVAPTEAYDVPVQAQRQASGMQRGAAPVQVSVPLEGVPVFFEKLLALGEELWISFDYKGL